MSTNTIPPLAHTRAQLSKRLLSALGTVDDSLWQIHLPYDHRTRRTTHVRDYIIATCDTVQFMVSPVNHGQCSIINLNDDTTNSGRYVEAEELGVELNKSYQQFLDEHPRPDKPTFDVSNKTPLTILHHDYTRPRNPYTEEWQHFREATINHRLDILADTSGGTESDPATSSPMRHLRMSQPGETCWSWDIITYPDHLVITGDIADGYVFTRQTDMMEFFALPPHRLDYYHDHAPVIDVRYWTEKLAQVLSNTRDTTTFYSEDAFISYLTDTTGEHIQGALENCGFDKGSAGYLNREADLTSRMNELIEDAKSHSEEQASAYQWCADHFTHIDQDYWEANFREYRSDFILACYAIATTVAAYYDHIGRDLPAH